MGTSTDSIQPVVVFHQPLLLSNYVLDLSSPDFFRLHNLLDANFAMHLIIFCGSSLHFSHFFHLSLPPCNVMCCFKRWPNDCLVLEIKSLRIYQCIVSL